MLQELTLSIFFYTVQHPGHPKLPFGGPASELPPRGELGTMSHYFTAEPDPVPHGSGMESLGRVA
jgi:hypothetical protein